MGVPLDDDGVGNPLEEATTVPDLELELDDGTTDEPLGAPDGPPPSLPADPLGFGFPDPPCADEEEPLMVVWEW